jgi:Mce-associated membrane protein
MSPQTPRRPASSRTATSRPRRLAGQRTVAPPADVESGLPPVESGVPPVESGVPPVESGVPPVETDEAPVEAPATRGRDGSSGGSPEPTGGSPESTGRAGLASLFDSRRATAVLVTLVAVLALVAGALFAWDGWHGDDTAEPSKEPVVLGSDDANAGVDAAAKAAETIIATSYQDYDKQVDEATALMTPAFAKEYRQTAEDIKDQFVQAKTELEARVVAQGVVHATPTEVQALVFLNEYVSKDKGDTTYTPYRALVTVVHTDRGWLVSGIDTK